jgi:hypothetical protein
MLQQRFLDITTTLFWALQQHFFFVTLTWGGRCSLYDVNEVLKKLREQNRVNEYFHKTKKT